LFDTLVSPDLRTGLLVLLVAVVFVLLIACANIEPAAGARIDSAKEMAVRTALGATRIRLVRQFDRELPFRPFAVLRACRSGSCRARANRSLPRVHCPFLTLRSTRTCQVRFCLTIATGLLFGLALAWRIATAKTNDTLKEVGRGSTGGIRSWLRGVWRPAK
jgi:hypothetical protein